MMRIIQVYFRISNSDDDKGSIVPFHALHHYSGTRGIGIVPNDTFNKQCPTDAVFVMGILILLSLYSTNNKTEPLI